MEKYWIFFERLFMEIQWVGELFHPWWSQLPISNPQNYRLDSVVYIFHFVLSINCDFLLHIKNKVRRKYWIFLKIVHWIWWVGELFHPWWSQFSISNPQKIQIRFCHAYFSFCPQYLNLSFYYATNIRRKYCLFGKFMHWIQWVGMLFHPWWSQLSISNPQNYRFESVMHIFSFCSQYQIWLSIIQKTK